MSAPAGEPSRVPDAAARRRLEWLPAALPGLVVLAVGLGLSLADGGFRPTAWYPVALGVLALGAMMAVLAPPRRTERSRVFDAALVVFAVLALWHFASITWADDQGAAWDGANRALLYALVLWLVGSRRWSPTAATTGAAVVAGGTTLIALGALVSLSSGEGLAGSFYEGRLAAPVDYASANANLWLIGFFPAVALAASTHLRWPLRGLALAAATFLLQSAFLSQSRGAALALAVTSVVFVVIAPRRWAALAAVGTPLALTALVFDPLNAVRTAESVPALETALDAALRDMLLCALAALVLGVAAALAGTRLPAGVRSPSAQRAGNLAFAALGVAVVVAGAVAIGNPQAWADDRWQDFKSSGYDHVEEASTRLAGGLGSNRYDFWRVSLEQFGDHPVRGEGADNFAVPYLQQRRSREAPRHPHSLAFRLLGQLGLIGTALFVVFCVLSAVAAATALRRCGREHGVLVAGALSGALVWLVHGQVDWLWEFPALSVLALALLALAVRVTPGEAPPVARARTSRLPAIGVGIATLVAGLSLAGPGIAARFTSAAYADFSSDPGLALARLQRAADFNPLTAEPLVTRGVLARRLGAQRIARQSLQAALERQPSNWFGHFELALLEVESGNTTRARVQAEAARQLNPRQPLVVELIRALVSGRKVDAASLERRLYGQLSGRLTPTGGE
jgi:hypothetical protein